MKTDETKNQFHPETFVRLARVRCPPSEIRRNRCNIFLNAEEEAKLDADAAARGLNRADYVRMLIMGQATEIVVRGHAADPHLIEELNRIGNNLNQAVRDSHMGARRQHDWEAMQNTLEELLTRIALGADENHVH